MSSSQEGAKELASRIESQLERPADRHGFKIAVICALPLEADAVDAVFDFGWDSLSFGKAQGDPNAYSTGTIEGHNVVLAHMPGMGKANAAAVAANIRSSFPNIGLVLVVGACGCSPFTPDGDEIILGDVIISTGVVQYDLGRRFPEQFVRKDTLSESLGRPNAEIRSFLAKLRCFRGRKLLQDRMARHIAILQHESGLAAHYPGTKHDMLFESAYRHVSDGKLCNDCGCDGELRPRSRLLQDSPQPMVYFGTFASGDTVVKSGQDRDNLVRQEDVIGFEMEGAGVWDSFPCVIIEGACDYADSHKVKEWQRYAAATAAACMKAFLESWTPSSIQSEPKATSGLTISPGLPITLIPFLRNSNFVGRDSILESLKRKLFFHQDCQKLAIIGLGGIGKTQVALQFAYWVRDYYPEYTILWVSALSRQSFEQTFTDIGKKLGILTSMDDGEPMDLVRKHLSSESAGKWLLIVDNADNEEILPTPSGICDYIPVSEAGLTVFTSRSIHIGLSVAGSDIIELHEMNDKEAERFLENSLIRKNLLQDRGATTELLCELTNLPLAIAQAAAYLNRNRTPIRRYLWLLHNAEQDLVSLMSREFQDSTRYRGSQNAIATTWIVSFDQIRRVDPLAAKILSFVACVEPKALPRQLLPMNETEEALEHAIGTLSAYGFLRPREDNDIYDMHSLVHLAISIWLKREGTFDETITWALQYMQKTFPFSISLSNRQEWQGLLPHARRILGRSEGYQTEGRNSLLFSVGRCLFQNRQFRIAIDYFEELSRCGETTASDKKRFGQLVNGWLGDAYYELRRMKESLSLLESAVEAEKVLNEAHPGRLTAEHNLAVAYLGVRRTKDAIAILEHVVEVRRRTLDEEDKTRLASERGLAKAYLRDGRTGDAIAMLERVTEVGRKTLNEEDEGRLASEHGLAVAYFQVRRTKEAIAILEHVAEIRRKTLDEEDNTRLGSEGYLAAAYFEDGQIRSATAIIKRVVEVQSKTLDDEDDNRLAAEQLLARVLESK